MGTFCKQTPLVRRDFAVVPATNNYWHFVLTQALLLTTGFLDPSVFTYTDTRGSKLLSVKCHFLYKMMLLLGFSIQLNTLNTCLSYQVIESAIRMLTYHDISFNGFMFLGCSFHSSYVIAKVVLWHQALVLIQPCLSQGSLWVLTIMIKTSVTVYS